MLQIILTLAIFLILVIPMGKYMYHIATEQKTFADKVFNPVDHLLYKICGIQGENMGWKKYALSLLTANAVMVFIGYLVLRIQHLLFLNPNGIDGMESTLYFNTIISFMTNTNLQHYSGESGLTYVSQMCVIIFMMFTSAASDNNDWKNYHRAILPVNQTDVGSIQRLMKYISLHRTKLLMEIEEQPIQSSPESS